MLGGWEIILILASVTVFLFPFTLLRIIGEWKVFSKAGKPGWAALIPVYNKIVLIDVAGKPLWWIILCYVPLAHIVVTIMVLASVARNFDRGVGITIGLYFLPMVFYPVLGFGSARYAPVQTA